MFNATSDSLVVQLVLLTLILGSVITWTLIVVKSIQVWLIRKQNVKYRESFWSAPSFEVASNLKENFNGPAYRVAQVGFRAILELESNLANDLNHFGDRQDVLERALRQQIQKERVSR